MPHVAGAAVEAARWPSPLAHIVLVHYYNASKFVGLAARGTTPAAFDTRRTPSGGVAPRSNTDGILARRALPVGRIARLGATRDLHHGLLAQRPRLRRLDFRAIINSQPPTA